MPPHVERHFRSSAVVRDFIIGLADGLTVPFALAAGLSGAVDSTTIIITAGLAEIAAGSIAMGLGGYLAAKSEMEHYASEQAREHSEVLEKPEVEEQEVIDVFRAYGVAREDSLPIVAALKRNREAWVNFMMRFELGLEKPNPSRALTSTVTIGGAYVAGGFVPLAPYMLIPETGDALVVSAAVTLTFLILFGYIKGKFTGMPQWKSAAQTTLVGSLAAGAAYLIARLIS